PGLGTGPRPESVGLGRVDRAEQRARELVVSAQNPILASGVNASSHYHDVDNRDDTTFAMVSMWNAGSGCSTCATPTSPPRWRTSTRASSGSAARRVGRTARSRAQPPGPAWLRPGVGPRPLRARDRAHLGSDAHGRLLGAGARTPGPRVPWPRRGVDTIAERSAAAHRLESADLAGARAELSNLLLHAGSPLSRTLGAGGERAGRVYGVSRLPFLPAGSPALGRRDSLGSYP